MATFSAGGGNAASGSATAIASGGMKRSGNAMLVAGSAMLVAGSAMKCSGKTGQNVCGLDIRAGVAGKSSGGARKIFGVAGAIDGDGGIFGDFGNANPSAAGDEHGFADALSKLANDFHELAGADI